MSAAVLTPTLNSRVGSLDEFCGTEGVYLLPHHQDEIDRLQRQHNFIKTATDGQLVPVKLPAGARILDSGCADGTWLADVGGLLTNNIMSLDLHGVDIGSSLFRNHPSLDLRQHDIRQPFPESWRWSDSFDLVHQRLLVWGIGAHEWETVINNLVQVVKPGGHLLLVEAEWVLPTYTNDQVQQKKLGAVQEWSGMHSGFDVHIWKKFAAMLRPRGFDIEELSFDLGYGATAKREQDRTWTAELLPQSFRHLARNIPDTGIPGAADNTVEYMQFLDDLVIEMKQIGYTPKLKWLLARKTV